MDYISITTDFLDSISQNCFICIVWKLWKTELVPLDSLHLRVIEDETASLGFLCFLFNVTKMLHLYCKNFLSPVVPDPSTRWQKILSNSFSAKVSRQKFLIKSFSAKISQQKFLCKNFSAKVGHQKYLVKNFSAIVSWQKFLVMNFSAKVSHQKFLGKKIICKKIICKNSWQHFLSWGRGRNVICCHAGGLSCYILNLKLWISSNIHSIRNFGCPFRVYEQREWAMKNK